MNRRFKVVGWILGVVMLVVAVVPVFGHSHAGDDPHSSVLTSVSKMAAATSGAFSDTHHDAHHGVCASICVVPLVEDATFTVDVNLDWKLQFLIADYDSDSHIGEGPRKPPRI